MKALPDRRASWYLRGLIRKPLRKIGVIVLHDVEHRLPGEIAMVFGKQPVHVCELFGGHGLAPDRRRRLRRAERYDFKQKIPANIPVVVAAMISLSELFISLRSVLPKIGSP
jgi:hypothetical protein